MMSVSSSGLGYVASNVVTAVGLIPELYRNYGAEVDETAGEYPNVQVDEMQVDDVVMGDESDASTLGRKTALEAIVHDDPSFWQAFFATLAETHKLSDVWTIATDRMVAVEDGDSVITETHKLSDVWTIATDRMVAVEDGDSVITDSAQNKLLTYLYRTSPTGSGL